MNIQQLSDEAELCGSPGGCYLRNQKAKYTAEPPDISNELPIVSKYHHGGRLQKVILSAFSSTCRPFFCAFQDSDYMQEYLPGKSLLLSHPVPKTNLYHCFFFPLLLFFSQGRN